MPEPEWQTTGWWKGVLDTLHYKGKVFSITQYIGQCPLVLLMDSLGQGKALGTEHVKWSLRRKQHVEVGRLPSLHWRPHERRTMRRGIWESTEHLLQNRGKPRKTSMEMVGAGPSGCGLTSSLQAAVPVHDPLPPQPGGHWMCGAAWRTTCTCFLQMSGSWATVQGHAGRILSEVQLWNTKISSYLTENTASPLQRPTC